MCCFTVHQQNLLVTQYVALSNCIFMHCFAMHSLLFASYCLKVFILLIKPHGYFYSIQIYWSHTGFIKKNSALFSPYDKPWKQTAATINLHATFTVVCKHTAPPREGFITPAVSGRTWRRSLYGHGNGPSRGRTCTRKWWRWTAEGRLLRSIPKGASPSLATCSGGRPWAPPTPWALG